jgi:nitrous oxidase accessory protein NosD
VDLRDAWGCAVSANTFTMSARLGVRVGAGSGRIAITGNNFSNAHIGGKTKRDDAATGVVLDGASDVAISGNIFTGLQGAAVRASENCQRIAVAGNVMADLHIAAKGAGGPRLALQLGGARQAVVGHNVLEQLQAPGGKPK